MATNTNYYEEFNISADMSIEEIKSKLTQLENVWNQRLLNEPEKANGVLSLIKEAKDSFSSVEAKAEYDKMLELSISIEPKGNEKLEEFSKAKAEVENYTKSEQWDLAKLAAEKMLSLVSGSGIEGSKEEWNALALAAEAFSRNELFDQALECANKAILLDPDAVEGYFNKELVLFNYIEKKKKQNMDYSQLVNNYRTTCQVWTKKAQEKSVPDSAKRALYLLGGSYLNYIPKDFDKGEQSAIEALKIDPNYEDAKRILDFVNTDRKVDLDELNIYMNEPDYFTEEIQDLIKSLLSSNPPMQKFGYPLCTKRYRWCEAYYEDENAKIDSEREEIFAISKEGELIKHYRENTKKTPYTSGILHTEHIKEEKKEWTDKIQLSDFKREFDFTGHALYSHSYGVDSYFGLQLYREIHAETMSEILYNANLGKTCGHFQLYDLVRHGRKKGYGLYKLLQNIVDKEKEYLKACKEANEKYDAEIGPMKEQITLEYEKKRSTIESEKRSKIEEALENDKEIEKLNNQLSSMESEYSKLGLFAGKRKKELQKEMEPLKQRLSELQGSNQVRLYYEQLISKLDSEEKSAISKAEQTVRNKYPLPRK